MKHTGFFIKRFFSPDNLTRSLKTMRRVTIFGIALAVAALVLVVSSASGFRKVYKKSILDFNAHIMVMEINKAVGPQKALSDINEFRYSEGEKEFYDKWKWFVPVVNVWPSLFGEFGRQLLNLRTVGVEGVTPFVYEEVLIAGQSGIRGVVVKGVDPYTMGDVNQMQMDFAGKSIVEAVSSATIPVVLGEQLAKELGVQIGGTLKMFLASEGAFKVANIVGIFSSGLYDYDSKFILLPIENMWEIFGIPKGDFGGIEIRLDDPSKAKFVANEIAERFPYLGRPLTWYELNRDLFAAVKLEGIISTILIGMLILVAGLNIITVLVLVCYL